MHPKCVLSVARMRIILKGKLALNISSLTILFIDIDAIWPADFQVPTALDSFFGLQDDCLMNTIIIYAIHQHEAMKEIL
jgi:hypothetical protein